MGIFNCHVTGIKRDKWENEKRYNKPLFVLLHQNEKRNATAAPLVFRFSFDDICSCAERPKVDAAMWSEHPRSKFARALEELGKMDH